KAADHSDPTKLFDWTELEAVALESQKAVDNVFGEYTKGTTHPPLKTGVNLIDAWDDKVKDLKAGGKPKEDERAAWRAQKIIEGEETADLDKEHGAVQSRPAESVIVARVKAAMVKKYRKE